MPPKSRAQPVYWHTDIDLLMAAVYISSGLLVILTSISYLKPSWFSGKERHWHFFIPSIMAVLFAIAVNLAAKFRSSRGVFEWILTLLVVDFPTLP